MQNKGQRYRKTMNVADVMAASPFAKLLEKSLQINALNEKIGKLFPAALQGRFRLGQIDGGTLFVEAENAMVRQGILFRQAEILRQIQQIQPDIRRIEVKINPDFWH